VDRFLHNNDLGRHTVRLYLIIFFLSSLKALYSPSGLTGFVMINRVALSQTALLPLCCESAQDHIQFCVVHEGLVFLVCKGLKFPAFLRSLLSEKQKTITV